MVVLILADSNPGIHAHPARAPLPLAFPLPTLVTHPHALPLAAVTPLRLPGPRAKATEAARACNLAAAGAAALRAGWARSRTLCLKTCAQRLAVLPLRPADTLATTLADAGSSTLLCIGLGEHDGEQEKKKKQKLPHRKHHDI